MSAAAMPGRLPTARRATPAWCLALALARRAGISATPGLPGILGHAVRTAFLGEHCAQGEVEGRAVRSRIRIEVTFDNRRPPNS